MVAELYPHIANAVYDRPWAIRESMLVTITSILEARIRGERLSEDDIALRLQGKGPARRLGYVAGDVAVIPVYGTIFPKADAFNDMSGGTSLSSLTDAIYEANNDEHVKAMVLDIDSPGGMAEGLPEFTQDLQGMGRNKPLIAVANHMAASAAYWIASQADEIISTPSATTGSIGVFAAHRDVSGMEEKRGVKTTLVSAGKYKTELSPYGPLSESGLEHVQGLVDYTYEQFVEAVAAGRHTSVDAVRSGYGEGRVLSARAALKAGLVDGIGTLNDTISRAQDGDAALAAGRVSIVVPTDITTNDNIAANVLAPVPGGDAGGTYTERLETTLREVTELVADAGRFASLTEVKREQIMALRQKLEDLLAEPGAAADTPVADAMTEDAEHAYAMLGFRLNDDEEE
jgi:signal peptide peptidase SppA